MANNTARLGYLATYVNGYAFKPSDWGDTGLPIIRKAQEKQEPPAPREKKADTRPARGNRSQQAARRQLTICENTIAKLESEIADLDGQMQQVGRDPDKLAEVYAKKLETENTLQEQMARWEELSLQLEE